MRSRANSYYPSYSSSYYLRLTEYIRVIKLSASDHTLSLRLHLYERLSTVFIFINLFNLFQIYSTATTTSNLAIKLHRSTILQRLICTQRTVIFAVLKTII